MAAISLAGGISNVTDARLPITSKGPMSASAPVALSEKERAACRIVMRTLRRVRCPIDHIQKDKQAIAELPSGSFENVIAKISRRWKCRPRLGTPEPLTQAHLREIEEQISFAYLSIARSAYHASCALPVFTQRGAGVIPNCQMRPTFSAPAFRVSSADSPASAAIFHPTRADIDNLVKTLASRKDIFPWDYVRDGCYARAMLIIRFLEMMGVPSTRISKTFLAVPRALAFPQKEGYKWNYHVMCTVTLADDTVVGLDPGLEPERALSLEEWVGKQKPTAAPLQSLPKQLRPTEITYDPQESVLFQSSPNLRVVDHQVTEGVMVLEEETDESAADGLAKISEYRELLDAKLLRNALPVASTYLEAVYPRAVTLYAKSF